MAATDHAGIEGLNRSGFGMIDPPVEIDMLREYWRDPAPFEAEREVHYARMRELFAVQDAKWRAEQEARWAAEGEGL